MEIISVDEMRALCSRVADAMPGEPGPRVVASQQMTLAATIIYRTTGVDLSEPAPPHLGDYMYIPPGVEHGHLRIIDRMMELADAIYCLRHVANIERRIERLKTDRWHNTAYELRLAATLKRNGWPIKFVAEQGRRGEDYDLIVTVGDRDVCVEAKSRSASHRYTPSGLLSTLKAARKQLPEDQPGIVVLDIPDTWLSDATFSTGLGEVVAEFLRTTRRVNLVQIVAKRYLAVPGRGLVQHYRWRQMNPTPRIPAPQLDRLTEAHLVPRLSGLDSRVLSSFWDDYTAAS